MASTRDSKPILLTPDYFRTKLVVDDTTNGEMTATSTGAVRLTEEAETDGETTAIASTAVCSPLTEPEVTAGSTTATLNSPGETTSVLHSGAQHQASKQTTSSWRTRTTPVAEAAIRREQENKQRKGALVEKEDRALACNSPVSLETSAATRDWANWTLNDLDTADIETTKPFLGSAKTSSPPSSSSTDSRSWGKLSFTDTSPSIAHLDGHNLSTKPMEECVVTADVPVLTEDELFARELQTEEYSKDSQSLDWVTKENDLHIARVYQQDLDASAALELQQQESRYGIV